MNDHTNSNFNSSLDDLVGSSGGAEPINERELLAQDLHQRVLELTILDQVSRALNSTLDIKDLARIILIGATAGEGLGFNRAFLFLLSDNKRTLDGYMAIGPADESDAHQIWAKIQTENTKLTDLLASHTEVDIDQNRRVNEMVQQCHFSMEEENNLFVTCVRGKRPIHISNASPELAGQFQTHEMVMVPLFTSEQEIGLLMVDHAITKKPITQDDIRFLRIYASHASIALENAALHNQLQRYVKELEEANRVLRDSQARLVHAERLSTVGAVAATLAHEIRNPLVSIGGFARTMLKKTTMNEPNYQFLKIITEEVTRLERIVNDVLGYSRPHKLRLQWMSIHEVVHSAVQMLQSEFKSSQVEAEYELADTSDCLWFDPELLKQVLLNLFHNAIHAMPSGGVLRVSSQKQNGYIVLSVTDTGSGIPSEIIEKIFTPFFTTKSTGSGLGLVIAQDIIRQHGGNIQVESNPGQGTTFRIALPLEKRRSPRI